MQTSLARWAEVPLTTRTLDQGKTYRRSWTLESSRISAIVAGERGITGESALRLGRYFDTTADYWINPQARYDLETARDAWESRIASEVKPHHAA